MKHMSENTDDEGTLRDEDRDAGWGDEDGYEREQ